MSRLLFKGPFIPYFPDLQAKVGTHGSLILSVIGYLLYENANQGFNYREGRYWVYKEHANGDPFTMRDWHKTYFPGDGLNTVIRAFDRLEKAGLLISGCYNEDRRNRTKWYTINFTKYDELMEEIDNDDKVWKELRKADLKNAFTQNGQKGKIGDTEDDYGKSPLEPSNDSFTQNGQMQLPKMGKSNIYKENNNNKSQATDSKKEEKPVAHLVDPNLKLEGMYRDEVKAKCLYSDETIDYITREFIDKHYTEKTIRIEWQTYLRTYCLNRYKSEQKSPTRARPPVTDAEKTPAQTLWARLWKYWMGCKTGRELSESGLGYFKGHSLSDDCFRVEALESYKNKIDVQRCHELISDALAAVKMQINRVDFVWR